MRLIDISTPKYPSTFVKVDDEDFEKLNKHKWHPQKGSGTSLYARREQTLNGKITKILMHREILSTPKGVETDHRDNDTLNNQRINLRLSTSKQNAKNKRLSKSNTSGYKGVCWDKYCSKWKASIRVDMIRKHLGNFNTPEEAALAYNYASEIYHGEFSKPNKITLPLLLAMF